MAKIISPKKIKLESSETIVNFFVITGKILRKCRWKGQICENNLKKLFDIEKKLGRDHWYLWGRVSNKWR